VTVHYSVKARVATVRLDRPEVFNALDRPTLEGIRDSFRSASSDHSVGVVVLTGTGDRAFCTGADLDEQQAFLERPNDYWDWMGFFIRTIESKLGKRAELRMMGRWGADAVGMSTAPEVIAARHMGMRVLGITAVTDMATGEHVLPVTHEEVLATAKEIEPKFIRLVRRIVKEMPV